MMRADDDLPAEVVAALREGRKVQAIKRLREHEGLGLKDAKERVDAHVANYPERYPQPEPGSGGRFIFYAVMLLAIALTVRFIIER